MVAFMPPARVIRRFAALLAVSVTLAGCASAPGLRPPTPLPEGKYVEVGGAGTAHGGIEQAGAGPAAWGRIAIADMVDITIAGHGGAALGYDALTILEKVALGAQGVPVGFGGYSYGGSVGLRFRYAIFDSLYVGIGAHLDYLEHNYIGYPERFVSAQVGIPVAERLYEDLWIYIRPTVGLSLPLYKEATDPFFGIVESPIGITYQFNEWVSVLAEGGYYMPTNGVYGAVGAAVYF